jgi:hypothetical protein
MPKKRSWTEHMLRVAVASSLTKREVLTRLNLVPAGGNYAQIQKYIGELKIDTSHLLGHGWSRGKMLPFKPVVPIEDILVKGSTYQSHKLRKRLIMIGLKKEACEECGWARKSEDGRIPLELDHIDGDRLNNSLKNLRILCPNCHSLKLTHRGRNKGKRHV